MEACKKSAPLSQLGAARWHVVDVIRDILGDDAVALAQSDVEPGKTLIRHGEWAGFSPAVHGTMQDWMAELGIKPASIPPVIELLDLNASDAASVAAAAHEACHAWLYQRFPENNLYRDEAYTNRLAGEWVCANLQGFQQHVAREAILVSNISYGLN
ncbi:MULTISPECIES: hypothetical protein [Cupriavidus]|uniref:Uncharacterized protein n=1 Tax=Cupriavidus oxalaticus TaxID=96344 RepID=A0A5P3VU79_9BURK|nr:hypothetical protein [Cupriavidus oxalaticus]QEZ48831.1 hypothetical protein D2917_31665 [Cupriavidus oxalaticus]